jgi:CheY-like chemotaxis protein
MEAPRAVPVLQDLPDHIRMALLPRRVLVVEDSLDSMHTLVLLLREMGHTVKFAVNGPAALVAAERFRPEFVLLDIGLPGIDGIDVCRRIKADPQLAATRIFALTAYDTEEYRARTKAAGCERHLVKPVSTRVLEDLLISQAPSL